MRTKYWIRPYKTASASARALAGALQGKVIKSRDSRYRWRYNHAVINWGNSTDIGLYHEELNNHEAVEVAQSKLDSFLALQEAEVSVPPFALNWGTAAAWGEAGEVVVCRTLLRANSGRGIVVASTTEELVDAPLYVKYIKKQDEYRVHVFTGHVIDVQRKMRNRDVPGEQVNWQVRNHSNGFVFGRGGVEASERLKQLAVDAVEAIGLDFGAVDIIYNARHDTYYVLEVNTAPGLTGTTLDKYTQAITQHFGE